MGTQVFANAARGSLNAAITDVATSITLKSGHGAVFPVANLGANPLTSSGNWFKAVLQDEGGIEIVYVRTHGSNSDTFTNVMRGQEGTTARAFAANAAFGLRMTAADLAAAVAAAAATWVANDAYTVNKLAWLTSSSGRLFRCIVAHSGRSTTPDADPTYWVEVGALGVLPAGWKFTADATALVFHRPDGKTVGYIDTDGVFTAGDVARDPGLPS